MYNVSARDIHVHNAVVGMAAFFGGFVQLLAGMWEFPRGNVLGASGESPPPTY
jgi:succinate-acetate transporter protein